MTKFKEYVRSKGFQLESDMERLPFEGVEEVMVIPEKALLCIYHNAYGWMNIRFHADGSTEELWSNSDLHDAAVSREEHMAQKVLG